MIKKIKTYRKVKIATFDIETLGLIPKNFLYGIVYYGHSHKVFDNRYDMMNEIFSRKNKGKVFFAHNCEYDLTGLTDDNLFKVFDNNVIFRGSHFIMAKKKLYEKFLGFDDTGEKKYRREFVRFYDSMRILQSSLGHIGKVMDFPKLKIPDVLLNKDNKDYEKFLDDFVLTDELIKYCLVDCELLYKALTDFQNFVWENYGCGLKPTISSVAFSIWKRNFQTELWHDCNVQHNEAFKRSYYGGRVDVFKWGMSELLSVFDVNSLYPAMGFKQYPHPYELFYTTKSDIYEDFEGCGLFEVTAPDIHIPILPYRYRNKLLFPIGKFRDWYNFNEIRYAVDNGYEVKFKYGYFSYKTTSPLKDYFGSIYRHRKQYPKEHYFNLILKYLLNSLYGRFGLKVENKKYMYDYQFWNTENNGWDFVTLSDDGYGYAVNYNDPYHFSESTYVAIPSYLTSYARIFLHQYLSQYPDSLVYCDTDSIFLENDSLDGSVISDKLGDFKFEGEYNKGWILGCKFYVLDNESELNVKIKGINFKDRLNSISELPDEYEQNSYFKTKESLRRNKISGSHKLYKRNINPYVFDKRTYDSDIDYKNESVTTYPIRINNI